MRQLYRLNNLLFYPLLALILTIAASSAARGESPTQAETTSANPSLIVGPPLSPESGGFASAVENDSEIPAESVKIDLPIEAEGESQIVNDEGEEQAGDSARVELTSVDRPLDDEAQLLVLKVTSKGYVMSYAVAAYDLGDNLYLSLFDISDALMFPIEVFDEEKRAEGWFIEKGNDFYLNIDANQLIIAGSNKTIAKEDIFISEEGLFISANALEEWFGIESTLNYSEQKLDIIAGDKLNFEAIVEREKRWEQKSNQRVRARKTYPYVDNLYTLAEPPTLTFQLGSTYAAAGGKTDLGGTYAVQGVGDLLYMSSDYFISGNRDNQFSDARLRLYRFDEDGKALPAIGATKFEIGDISPPSLNIVGGGSNERGVYVSNRNLNSVTAPDNFLIDGEVEPGYSVELYRNAEFIAFLDSTATSSGRYEFPGLSLDAGNNTFKIIKYGPHGEKEVEYRRFLIGTGMLKPGQWNYDLSLSQPGQQVIPVIDKDYKLDASPRIIAGAEVGVLETLSIGGGLYSGPIFGSEEHHGATLSVRNSLFGIYNRLDYLHNMDNSSIATFSQKTSIYDISLSNFIAYYDGFDISEQDLELTFDSNIGTSLDIFGTAVSIRFGGGYEKYQTDRTVTTLDNQISTSIFGYSLSNQLAWSQDKVGNSSLETMNGKLFFRDYFKDILTDSKYGILVRANLDYTVKPEFDFDSVDLSLEKNLSERTRLGLGYTQSLGQNKSWGATSRVSYEHDYFIVDVSGQYNNEGDYTVGTNFRFDIGYDSANKNYGLIKTRDAGRGTVTTFTYHDVNYNGTFDDGDIALEDIEFKSDDGNSGSSNASGIATINRQTGFRKTNLVLQTHSLPDIFLIPTRGGIQYMPRPGHLSHFEFPVVLGGEIDGEILPTEAGRAKSYDFSDIQVELVDKDGKVIKTVEADTTGYYLFEQVIPDDYQVRIIVESVLGLQLVVDSTKTISVPKQDPIINGLDLSVILPMELSDDVYGPIQPQYGPSPQSTANSEPRVKPAQTEPKEHYIKKIDSSEEYIEYPEDRFSDSVAAPVMSVGGGAEGQGSGGPTPELHNSLPWSSGR